jgi:hypothetical protein
VGSGELPGVWPAVLGSPELSVEGNEAACEHERGPRLLCLVSRTGATGQRWGVCPPASRWRDAVIVPSGASQAHIRDGIFEAGSREGGSRKVGIPKVGPVKAGFREVRPQEAGIPEVGGREVSPLEVGGREVGSAEIRGDLGMVSSPVIPGVDACAEFVKVVLVRHSIPSFRDLYKLWMFQHIQDNGWKLLLSGPLAQAAARPA